MPPLTFVREDVGGTPMMVADLAPTSTLVPLPFFLALGEHAALHAHHAAAWPGGGLGALAGSLSPERCQAELARSAHGNATSPCPGLVAQLLELLSAGAGSGSAEQVWRRARDTLLRKLCQESAHDAAVALERLPA